MEIKIEITDNGEVLAEGYAKTFESAEEELGKLERYIKSLKLEEKAE